MNHHMNGAIIASSIAKDDNASRTLLQAIVDDVPDNELLEMSRYTNIDVLISAFEHKRWSYIRGLLEETGSRRVNWNVVDIYSQCPLAALLSNRNLRDSAPVELVWKLVDNTDLRIQDYQGNSVLSWLFHAYDWKVIKQHLRHRKFHVRPNLEGRSPLDAMIPPHRVEFWNFVADNYIDMLLRGGDHRNVRYSDILCAKNSLDAQSSKKKVNENPCMKTIMERCQKTGDCYPVSKNPNTSLAHIPIAENEMPGSFSINYYLIWTYLAAISNRYSGSFCIPFNQFDNEGITSQLIHHADTQPDFTHSSGGTIAARRILTTLSYFPAARSAYVPFSIRDDVVYPHYSSTLQRAWINALRTNRRLIVTIVAIIPNEQPVGHMNIVIYDRHRRSLYRFDPMGGVFSAAAERAINKSLETTLSRVIEKAGEDVPQYSSSFQEQPYAGVQSRSLEWFDEVRKSYDVEGYCMAWSCAVLELLLLNPDSSATPARLMSRLENRLKRSGTRSISWVRRYGQRLSSDIEPIIANSGVSVNEWYSDQHKISTMAALGDVVQNILTTH
jgi:hypothetical protein